MKFSANSSDKKFENPDPGSYSAVCIRMIDLGTQETTWQGEKKTAHKCKIVFELSEKMSDGRPFIAMRDFTISLHEKSALRAFLTGWRGRDFTQEELMGFESRKLVGVPCLLSLVQNGEYINIASASKLPKGMEPVKPVNPLIYFALDEFDQNAFESLSEKIQEKISMSPEYKSLKNRGSGFDDIPDDQPWVDEPEEMAF